MNYRLIATEVGDLVKWDTSVNEHRGQGQTFIVHLKKRKDRNRKYEDQDTQ